MRRIALLLICVVAATGCSNILGLRDVTLVDAGPDPVDEPPPSKTSDPGSYTISTIVDRTRAADLASAMGSSNQRTVGWLLDHANRQMDPLCQIDSGEALYPLARGGTGAYGFCWNPEDRDSSAWIPQGITTTGDALTARAYDGREAVVITWYNAAAPGARISIAPAGGYRPGLNYRHLLLVTPQSGDTFSAVDCHAGGAVWYGNLLYVACTDSIKLFDWDYVYSADTNPFCDDIVGKANDPDLGASGYCASGYAYVMMQVGQITNPSGNLRFSSISFDRASTPDRLVVSEYSTSGHGKLVRFNLDFMTRLPANTSAADAYDMPFALVQGAVARGNKFWFHSSGGVAQAGEAVSLKYGKLRFWDSSTGRFVSYTSAYGAEALSFWPGSLASPDMPDASDMLYTLTEHAGYRAVIAVLRTSFE